MPKLAATQRAYKVMLAVGVYVPEILDPPLVSDQPSNVYPVFVIEPMVGKVIAVAP